MRKFIFRQSTMTQGELQLIASANAYQTDTEAVLNENSEIVKYLQTLLHHSNE